MTVKDLKETLEQFPDSMEVWIDDIVRPLNVVTEVSGDEFIDNHLVLS